MPERRPCPGRFTSPSKQGVCVERRSHGGLRVRGLLDSGLRYGMYNPGIIDPRYSGSGDLTFRCNMDYRGYVTDVRVKRRD